MMEAPSPAPVLIAEPIDKIKFIIDGNDKTINITLLNNNDRFNKVINIDDDFWKKNTFTLILVIKKQFVQLFLKKKSALTKKEVHIGKR